MNERNTIVASGYIENIGAIRLTPAGLFVIDFTLKHQSTQQQAQTDRKVQAEFLCIMISQTQQKVAQLKNQMPLKVRGFMAAKSARAQSHLILHVIEYEILN